MLAVTSYDEVYVQLAKARIDEHVTAYRALERAARGHAEVEAALGAFAPGYFNTALLALDHHFTHRMRGAEGKDGNPLNEVRMLCDAIMEHDGVMQPNKTIKYAAERSVAGVQLGHKIALDVETFERLAAAFLAEISKRFG